MSTERQEFVTEVINDSVAFLDNPLVKQHLGDARISHMKGLLVKAAIADVRDGVIEVPEGSRPNAAVILAIKPDEELTVGHGLRVLTPQQSRITLETIDLWKPTTCTSSDFIDFITQQITESADFFKIIPPSEHGGSTQSISSVIDIEAATEFMGLQSPPSDTLGRLMLRPFVVLNIGSAKPDLLYHELTHVKQRQQRPVRIYSSQHEAEMDCLRDELEAYHAGSAPRFAMVHNLPEDERTDPYYQLAVEGVRIRHNKGNADLFAPSDEILNYCREHGMGAILHNAFDFDRSLAIIKANSQQPDQE